MIAIRSAIFYFFYLLSGVWFGLTAPLVSWMPFDYRFRYVRYWNRFVLFLTRWVVGIRVRVEGLENLPDHACVVMSKHQSQWETVFLQTVFTPLCTILKQELLDIPFFGWGLRQLDPIAIDRSSPRDALKKVQTEGLARLSRGCSVLVFPEGTRVDPGQVKRYARSGANLAVSGQVPILPVAHNAGLFWPSDRFLKYPGTLTVIIGKPIDTSNEDARSLTEQVESWIESESEKLL